MDSEDVEQEEGICTEGHELQCQTARNLPSECTCNCRGANHGKLIKKVSSQEKDAVAKKILEEVNGK